MVLLTNGAMTVCVQKSSGAISVSFHGQTYSYDKGSTQVNQEQVSLVPQAVYQKENNTVIIEYGMFCGQITVPSENEVLFEIIADRSANVTEICWPGAIKVPAGANGAAVLPVMQGLLVRDPDPDTQNLWDGRFFGRDGTMPWWGQYNQNGGYFALVQTPYDAQYQYRHLQGESTQVSIQWIPCLGAFDQPRKIAFRFFDAPCDYSMFAQEYRKELEQAGELVPLRQKAQESPNLQRLIGRPILHGPVVYYQIEPESSYYKPDQPERNTCLVPFDTVCQMLRDIKQRGLEQAYVHLDGWGTYGYDNRHPSVLPPCPQAGGTEGLRRVLDVCREQDYLLAYHDQYRDFFYLSPDFDPEKAVTEQDGTVKNSERIIWYGGQEAQLCAKEALYYVKRNYTQMQKDGILPDGAYLDVFSASKLDECHHPKHRMTRQECAAARAECLDYIRSIGLIISSEEIMAPFVKHLDLVHHSPYFHSFAHGKGIEAVGIAVPLLNLVFHDCILTPWAIGSQRFGIPKAQKNPFLHCLLAAGVPYAQYDFDEEELNKVKFLCKVNKRLVFVPMLSHTLLEGDPRHQQAVYADGTTITVSFATGEYSVCFASGEVWEGTDTEALPQ